MDLRELGSGEIRHPWEIARYAAIRTILSRNMPADKNLCILDIGCGDAFVISSLCRDLHDIQADAIDIHLTKAQLVELHKHYSFVDFLCQFSKLSGKRYDIILMLDVLEHIKDDASFLRDISQRYLKQGGFVLITVPAFNFLFTSHDIFLNHYRRYNFKTLMHIIKPAKLCLERGYLFISLLPIRSLELLYEKFIDAVSLSTKGVGNWNHGVFISRIVELVLAFDNKISMLLNRFRIRIPGLTLWTVCKH